MIKLVVFSSNKGYYQNPGNVRKLIETGKVKDFFKKAASQSNTINAGTSILLYIQQNS